MELKWMAYRYDTNKRKIVEFNIFNHSGFTEDVKKDLKNCSAKEDFVEKLKNHLMYYFLSKAQYEIILTSLIPSITMSEINRINTEREKIIREYNREPYRLYVNLDVAEKIDIASQVMLNWDAFVDYVWSYKRSKK